MLPHNIKHHPKISMNVFENDMDSLIYYMKSELHFDITRKEIMEKIFYNNDLYYCDDSEKRWKQIPETPPLDPNILYYRVKNNEHSDTIIENTKLLDGIIELGNSRGAEVILTLIPQYFLVEEIYKSMNDKWKHVFYEKINCVLHKYSGVVFYDFKTEASISSKFHFYRDCSHLNTQGGYAMTSLLCDKIYG